MCECVSVQYRIMIASATRKYQRSECRKEEKKDWRNNKTIYLATSVRWLEEQRPWILHHDVVMNHVLLPRQTPNIPYDCPSIFSQDMCSPHNNLFKTVLSRYKQQ